MIRRDLILGLAGLLVGAFLGASLPLLTDAQADATIDTITFVKMLHSGSRRVHRTAPSPQTMKDRPAPTMISSSSASSAVVSDACRVVHEAFGKLNVVRTDQRRYGYVLMSMNKVEAEYCNPVK